MTQQIIDVGSAPNDGNGSPLRTAFEICNDNFTELFNSAGSTGIANGTSNVYIVKNSTVNISSANVPNVMVVSGTGATVNGTLVANPAISATGNVTASFFIGNGSQLTGISTSPSRIFNGTTEANIGTSSGNANISVGGTSNVAVFATTGLYVKGINSVTGNVIGNGFQYANGNPVTGTQGVSGTQGSTGTQGTVGQAGDHYHTLSSSNIAIS